MALQVWVICLNQAASSIVQMLSCAVCLVSTMWCWMTAWELRCQPRTIVTLCRRRAWHGEDPNIKLNYINWVINKEQNQLPSVFSVTVFTVVIVSLDLESKFPEHHMSRQPYYQIEKWTVKNNKIPKTHEHTVLIKIINLNSYYSPTP